MEKYKPKSFFVCVGLLMKERKEGRRGKKNQSGFTIDLESIVVEGIVKW